MSEFSKGFKSRRPNKSFYDPAFASGWWVFGLSVASDFLIGAFIGFSLGLSNR